MLASRGGAASTRHVMHWIMHLRYLWMKESDGRLRYVTRLKPSQGDTYGLFSGGYKRNQSNRANLYRYHNPYIVVREYGYNPDFPECYSFMFKNVKQEINCPSHPYAESGIQLKVEKDTSIGAGNVWSN